MIPDRFGWDRRPGMTPAEHEAWTRTAGDAASRVLKAWLLLAAWTDASPGWFWPLLAAVALTTFLVCVTAPLDR